MTGLVEALSLDDVRQHITTSDRVRATSGGTKSALSANATISLAGMSGVKDYDPSEYTFTALAGTPLAEIDSMLAEHHQFLPFDPPLAKSGGTIGGTISAGLSGPGRFRFGGARDFFLGVEVVTGGGRVVFGGGKVVKNAAGFDFPKLLVGSLGSLAVMTELTFKVFPAPETYRTLRIETRDVGEAVELVKQLSTAPIEMYCLDIHDRRDVLVRVGGLVAAIGARVDRIKSLAGLPSEILEGQEEQELWEAARELRWVKPDQHLVKVPLTPAAIPPLETEIEKTSLPVSRAYSVAGNLAWLGWPAGGLDALRSISQKLQWPALVLTGTCDQPVIDPRPRPPLLDRIASEFDPDGKLTS